MVGEKTWSRSKLMLVGQGFAGKTALSRSLMGKMFYSQTESTCGIDAFTVEASTGQLSDSGSWRKVDSIETNHFELVLAQLVAALESVNTGKVENGILQTARHGYSITALLFLVSQELFCSEKVPIVSNLGVQKEAVDAKTTSRYASSLERI
jgi:hypothetical protein